MPFKVVMVAANPFIPHNMEDYRKLGADFVTTPCQTEAEIVAAASDADFIITFGKPLTAGVVAQLGRCKMIYNDGTGYDSIDIDAATRYGICVSYPGSYCTEEVAEHTMVLILACARKIVRLDRAVRAGKWHSYEKREIRFQILPPLFPLTGRTLGLIGFGRIARSVVPRAKGFGLKVVAFDPNVPPRTCEELGVEPVSFDCLLANSDFISIHAAFTPAARHLLGAEHFKKMKPTAYLINCARGDFIDEAALVDALARGSIAGAALDVVQGENVGSGHPLLKFENVIITPHVAYYSEDSKLKLARRPYDEIARLVNGQWPQWLLNPEVKENFRRRWGKILPIQD